MPDDHAKSLVEYGVLGTVLAVTLGLFVKFLTAVFGDHGAREKRLSDRITALEAFVDNTLIEVVKHDSEVMQRCVKALEENTAAFIEFSKAAESMLKAMGFRPCLLPDSHPVKIAATKREIELAESKSHE